MSRYARVPEALLDDHRVSATAVRVFGRIERFQGSRQASYATRETLAEALGISRATVQRALAELLETGWITRQRTGSNTWRTIAHQEPQEVSSRLMDEPSEEVSDDSPVRHQAAQICAATTDVTTQGRAPGDSDMSPSRLKNESHKERALLDEHYSMSQTPVATLRVVDNEPAVIALFPLPPQDRAHTPPPSPVQALVAAYVDRCPGQPSKALRGAIGSAVKRLIEQDHFEPALILAAIDEAAPQGRRDLDRIIAAPGLTNRWNRQAERQRMFARWADIANTAQAKGF